MPTTSRRAIGGEVRTETATRFAPDSTRSAAISAPVFPKPATSTSLARVVRAGAVSARVDKRAAKCLPAGPLWDNRSVVLPGGDDDDRSAERGSRRLDDPAIPIAADTRHVRAQTDVEPEPHHVVAQVAGEFVLPDVAPKLTREWIVRETGEAPDRVEPKAVVTLGPAGADLGVALEHNRTDAEPRESARGREPRRPGAHNDDRHVIGHRRPILSVDRPTVQTAVSKLSPRYAPGEAPFRKTRPNRTPSARFKAVAACAIVSNGPGRSRTSARRFEACRSIR